MTQELFFIRGISLRNDIALKGVLRSIDRLIVHHCGKFNNLQVTIVSLHFIILIASHVCVAEFELMYSALLHVQGCAVLG